MDDNNLAELFTTTLRISNETTKEDFLTSLRALADQIDVEEIYKTTYTPETDAERTSYSAFNHPLSTPYYWSAADLSTERFSEAFGSGYDAHHVSPIIVNDIGDDYQLNPNYAKELAEKRQNNAIYNEDGTLKTETVEKGSTVTAPTYNRSLPPMKSTIEDAIASYIRSYVDAHGGSPEEFFNEVERIRDEKYKAFYEKKVGSTMDEIKGRVYEGGIKMPECIIQ